MGRSGKVRCGVIGAGWWATYAHLPALTQHPCARMVAIQKRCLDEARRVAADFGVPHAFTDWRELLDDDLDAAVIASSPNLHYEQALAAIERGLHVLVEKPMTITAAQAYHLVSAAERSGVQLLISCPWHYTAHARQARELVKNGRLGDVRMISVLMTNPVSHLIRGEENTVTHGVPYLVPHQETYSDPAIAGGGQIYAQVSHAAAYLTFLTGSRPAEVFAAFHQDGSCMDIYDAATIRMENGCLVSLASTGATPRTRRDHEVRVFGTRGLLFLDLWRGTMQLVSMDGSTRVDYPDLLDSEIYPEQAPARDLIDSILNDRPNGSPGTLGWSSMEVIEAACRSARTGANVVIRSQ
jgi:predicted dehydrogenase